MPEGPGAGDTVGDLAIVLHSHMPYVEGFGTYPFGEEWLFDAVIRSYLPVLEIARDLTLTITPSLADQLEAGGVGGRLRAFLERHRIGAAERDLEQVGPEYAAAVGAELERYRAAATALDGHGGDLLAPFLGAAERGRLSIMASTATHAVLPMLASRAGVDLQIDAGLRSHRRRFGRGGGFWLPECAYSPGLEWDLSRHGVEWFCVDQSRFERPGEALEPVRTEAGPLAFTIDWEAISWLWSLEGYPSHPAHLQFHAKTMEGCRIWRIGGGPYDPGAAREAAGRQAEEFCAAAADRLAGHRRRCGERGLLVFSVDTELLGHWWSEGPVWLRSVLERARASGLRLVTLETAAAEREGRAAGLEPSSWGDGKDLRTWDGREVSDLAWGGRRLELRLLQAVREGLSGSAAEHAARQLLAAQSSDWAFLDGRRQAGDYPFDRATSHAESMYEAIHSTSPVDAELRNLAPDLSLAPLLEP